MATSEQKAYGLLEKLKGTELADTVAELHDTVGEVMLGLHRDVTDIAASLTDCQSTSRAAFDAVGDLHKRLDELDFQSSSDRLLALRAEVDRVKRAIDSSAAGLDSRHKELYQWSVSLKGWCDQLSTRQSDLEQRTERLRVLVGRGQRILLLLLTISSAALGIGLWTMLS